MTDPAPRFSLTEAHWQAIVEDLSELISVSEPDGTLVYVNAAYAQHFGCVAGEMLGRNLIDFVHAPDRVAVRAHLDRLIAHGEVEVAVNRMAAAQGELRWVSWANRLVRDAHGEVVALHSVGRDITPQKLAEQALVQTEQRLTQELGRTHAHLDAVVDNVPATLGYWEADGTTRFANREFQAAMGLPIAQIIGRPLKEIHEAVDPVGYAAMAPHVAEVLQGRRQEFELAMLTMTGLRQLHVTLVPDQPEPGRVAGFYGLGYDITGRKALELRLSDSELRYRSLFDHLNSGFALHEVVVNGEGEPVDHKFLAMNAVYAEMTGLDPVRTVGRRLTELSPDRLGFDADWVRRLGQVALSGTPLHAEQWVEATDRWFEVVAYRPVPGQFAVLMQDITQRKHAQTQLALGEQRLRFLVDAVRDHAMCLLDAQGRIETWSAGAQRIKGYSADEMIGQHYRRFFHAEEVERGEPERQLVLAATLGQLNKEDWRYRKDGSRFWAGISLTPVRDAQGQLQGFVKVTRDLTEREKEHDLIRRVAELSPSAMLLIDETGRIVFANAQTERIFGYRRDELIGQAPSLLMPEAVQAFSGHSDTDFKAQRKDGSGFDVQVGISHFETEQGRAVLAAIVDVTERRRQQQRLQHALEEKETLLKEVYHRVKNNLQVVQSLLGLQRRSVPEGPARTALDESVQRVRAIALVHEKLYQSGTLASVSLPEYTHDLLKQISEAAGANARGIVLRAEVAALPTGLDSAIPFGLLIAELVGNALKHGFQGRAGGEVRISLETHVAGAMLWVCDDGVGLPPHFDLASPSTMGLQLAASLARQLGGELQALSNPTRFGALLTRL